LGKDCIQAEALAQLGQINRLAPYVGRGQQPLAHLLHQQLHLTWCQLTSPVTTQLIVHHGVQAANATLSN
jgi:hypothetical protein